MSSESTALALPSSAKLGIPALIAGAGDRASLRFLEFFTVNIRNRNTRGAYGRAAEAVPRWCEDRGLNRLQDVQPVHVAGYIKQLQGERSAPAVRQHLVCIRILFDWPANTGNRDAILRLCRLRENGLGT